ncbi:MAG: SusC/RagA family TonB-linked outer membrane protein [Salinibacter sp.]
MWMIDMNDLYLRISAFLLGLVLMLMGSGEVLAQQTGTVQGTVTDGENGQPLPGVNVVIEGTQQGTATRPNGRYEISDVDPGTYTIRASFVGYQEGVRQGVDVQAGETVTVDFSLSPSAEALEEVVVVGYGEQQQQEVTGSISQVSSQDLQDVQSPSIEEALQGLAAGVQVTSNGPPGEGARVRIRGLSTVNNNDPLFIVDGVEVNGLESINPSSIKSIEVLKDASASAIYGSRAAGGVVLITTKKGKPGDLRVNFSSSYGIQNTHQRLDLLNTQQYVNYAKDLKQDPPPRFQQQDFDANQNTDWQDQILQRGFLTNQNLSVSGGSETATYRVGLNYTSEKGTIRETGFERYSLRANTSFDIGRFTFSENLSLSHKQRDVIQSRGLLQLAMWFPPYVDVRNPDHDGGFEGLDNADGGPDIGNPVRIAELGRRTENETKVVGNLTAEFQIIDGINLKSVLGVDYSERTREHFTPSFFEGDFHAQDYASINERRFTYFQPVSTTTLNIDRAIGAHNFSGTFGAEVQNTSLKTVGASGRNPITDKAPVVGSAQSSIEVEGMEGEDVLISYFGRAQYNYDDRYLIEGALRRDGFSRFGPNYRWGFFPSASVGWNVHEEAFLEDVSAISRLKLRGSWGETGNNTALDRYEWQANVETGFRYNLDGRSVSAAGVPALANPDLRWETTEMMNVGVDLGFLENAITLSAGYYQNTTNEILLPVPLPSSFGFLEGTRVNTGEVTSTGFEFTAGYQSQSSGDFQWSVNANFSTSSNEVESLGLGSPIQGNSFALGGGGVAPNRVVEGQPLWHYYGWKVDRLYQEDDFASDGTLKDNLPSVGGTDCPDPENCTSPGDIKFKDTDGDGDIDAEDRVDLGSPHPDFAYGLTASAQWKNFDLALSLEGKGGYKIVQKYALRTQGMARLWNAETTVLDRWTPQNTNTDVPRAVLGDPNNNNRFSDRYLDDGDYLRIQRVTLGYQIPVESLGLSQMTTVRRARIYVQSANLATFTGYEGLDPTVSGVSPSTPEQQADRGFATDTGTYATPRRFTVGLQLNF